MRAVGVALSGFLLSAAACSDERLATSSGLGESDPRHEIALFTAPFACGVEYTVVSTLQDDLLQSYDMPTLVDTARVCGTWTGSDYRVHVQQIGSSAPAGETADPLVTATFDGGYTNGSDATGASVADPSSVASSAFDLGQATANEQQASYNEPYYGVTGGGGGGGGGGGTCITDCEYATIRVGEAGTAAAVMSANANPRAGDVKKNQHGVSRAAMRALLGDKDEISRGANGHRRFRLVKGDEEEILELDPATDLLSAQEVRSPAGRTRAELKWSKTKDGRYVREWMEVTSTEIVDGKSRKSKATIRILDLRVGGNQ